MRGIDKFKERFAGHDGEYVLIGGGACDLLFGEASHFEDAGAQVFEFEVEVLRGVIVHAA